jgi:hypothetical protein
MRDGCYDVTPLVPAIEMEQVIINWISIARNERALGKEAADKAVTMLQQHRGNVHVEAFFKRYTEIENDKILAARINALKQAVK